MVDARSLLEAVRSLARFEDLHIGDEHVVSGYTVVPAAGTRIGFNVDPETDPAELPANDMDELLRLASRVLAMTADQLDRLLREVAMWVELERDDPESNAALAFDPNHSPVSDDRTGLQVTSVAISRDTILVRFEWPGRFPLLDIIASCDETFTVCDVQV